MNNIETTATINKMTEAGREFMTLVGQKRFDFFDDGIVADSGNFGDHMAWQASEWMGKSRRSMGGIMGRLLALDLWTADEFDGDKWWALTELGAAVANTLAEVDAETEVEVEAEVEVEVEDGEDNRPMTRKECLAALAEVGYDGPTSYLMPKLRSIVEEATSAN